MIAERLFETPPLAVFWRGSQHGLHYLMRVSAGSSDTPDCIVGFVDIGKAPGSGNFCLLHSERRIPSILAKLEGGFLKWAQPVSPTADILSPGTGWFWYTDGNCPLEGSRVARTFAQASRHPDAKRLIGIAQLGTEVVLWADIAQTNCVAEWLDRLAFELATKE